MEYGIYFAFWFFLMLSLMNKCYRIYIACILFINMRYAFDMLLLKHPVLYVYILRLKFQYIKLSQASTSQQPQLFTRRYIQTIQPNGAIAKQNFSKFRLRSTNSLFKMKALNQITQPLDH